MTFLALVGLFDRDATVGLGDRRRTLRGTGLEELLHTRQTLGDVVGRGRTTGVEGTHRQLRAGLTDRLGRDDADGLADVDELAGRERTAVALRADTDSRVAGEHGAHLDRLDTRLDQRVDAARRPRRRRPRRATLPCGVDDVGGERAREHRVLDVRVAHQHAVGIRRGDRQLEALGRAAVVLADDDILRDVDETTGQVARVGGTQGRVGQTLAGTVRRDEVLRHRQTLAVRGDDRTRDDLTLRVVHQTTHTGDVADLQPVTTSTRGHHAVDGVVLREVRPHRGLRPRRCASVQILMSS